MTASDKTVVGVLAEALAQHREGSAWVVSSGANQLTVMEYCCGCGWRVRGAWADGSPHLAHVASVVAALPNIAVVMLPTELSGRHVSNRDLRKRLAKLIRHTLRGNRNVDAIDAVLADAILKMPTIAGLLAVARAAGGQA